LDIGVLGSLGATDVYGVQGGEQFLLSLGGVFLGNIVRQDERPGPSLTAAEQEQDAENSSTNKTASSDTLHHGGTSCRYGTISLRWSRNDEFQLAATLFISYDTMI